MVSFSLETQISLSKAIERDFDTQSKSCLPFFLPPGSFERLNAKISISSSWLAAAPASSRARASYCQRVERTMGVGERWATPSLKSSPSSSSVTLHQHGTPSSSQFKKMFVTTPMHYRQNFPKVLKGQISFAAWLRDLKIQAFSEKAYPKHLNRLELNKHLNNKS